MRFESASSAESFSLLYTQRISSLKLRHHFRRVPIGVQRLDFSGLVHFQNIDAFEVYFAARVADPVSCPFHCRPVAGDKNFILSQAYLFESGGNRLKKLAKFLMAVDWRGAN